MNHCSWKLMNVKLMKLCNCIEQSIFVLSESVMKVKLKTLKMVLPSGLLAEVI